MGHPVVALGLRMQCHRLSDAALVITAPGRLVLFAQRSPWRGSSRLDMPDLRPAQTRTATSPHPLCAAPLPARLGSQLAKVHRGEWVRGHRHKSAVGRRVDDGSGEKHFAGATKLSR